MKITSKFLSLVLRHKPESIGLALDANGWVDIGQLIEKCRSAGRAIDRAMLEDIVASNDKKRFTLSEDGQRIRAAQGHSVDVDLALAPVEPPDVLYHGTASRFVASIRAQGVLPGTRRQVHLSPTMEIARAVGMRHGTPVVLVEQALRMHTDGYRFTRADNGVWLTDAVPAKYLED